MKNRIFKYYLILISLVLLVTMLFTTKVAQNYYKDEVENKLLSIAFSLEYYLLGAQAKDIDYDDLARDFAGNYTADNNLSEKSLRITFVDFTGKVLGDSEADYKGMENHLDRKEIREAVAGNRGKDIRPSKTMGLDFLYVAVPLKPMQVIVRAAVPLVQLAKINRMVRFYALLTFLAALLLSMFVSWKITTSITKPLLDMTLASQEIANGNYKKRIRVNTSDELGQLALNFNEMSAKLDATVIDLNNKKIEMESIINSMTNGLVAVDNDLNIILINPEAFRLFAINTAADLAGIKIVQYIRNNQINSLLKETIHTGKNLECNIHYGGRIFYIKTSPIRSPNNNGNNSGGLVFIQDITKVRKLEQIRTEFVSNVTHELKTPITSIRGFIETLKNGAIADKEVAGKFLDIIDIEAERLYVLIEDILRLSEIETKQKDTDLENLNLIDVVGEVFTILQPLADEKNISLNYSAKEKVVIEANKNRMKQLLLNLVDNGIKYNKPHGAVDITAIREKGRIVIIVKDTGIGIPSRHLNRIFERFYRVDKGRPRDMGGTGLGLSIVKHIVNLYSGDIKVSSELDKGTEFIIQLPC